MLNKIILELSMNLSVLDASMCCEETMHHVCIVFWLNLIPIGDVPKVLRHLTFVFNDHVKQDDATCHYLRPVVSDTRRGHEQWQRASEAHLKLSPHPSFSTLDTLGSEIFCCLEDTTSQMWPMKGRCHL